MIRTLLRLLAFSLVAASTALVQADVAFTNFGSGYQIFSGQIVSGANSVYNPQSPAFQFTSGATGTITTIDIGVNYELGDNHGLLKLFADDAGDTIGAVLGSWSFENMPAFTSGGPAIQITNLSPVSLTMGTKYWVGMEVYGPDDQYYWMYSNQFTVGRGAVSYDNGETWDYRDNFDQCAITINVNPVPEPGSMGVLSLGVAVLIRRIRRGARPGSTN